MRSIQPAVRRDLPPPDADRSRPGDLRPAAAVAAAAVLVVLAYALPWGIRHLRVPVADDLFYYTGAIRTVAAEGLRSPHLAARPAYPLVAAVLQAAVGGTPWSTAVAVPLAMVGAFAASLGALARRWHAGPVALATVVLVGGLAATTSRLVLGKSENLMNLWLLAAALAVVIWAGGRRALAAVALLAFVAGAVESPFLAAFAGLLVATIAARHLLPRLLPRRAGRWAVRPAVASAGGGRRDPGYLSLPRALLATAIGSAGVVAVVFGINGTTPADVVQKLIPAYQYAARLRQELGFAWPWITLPLGVAGWWTIRRPPRQARGALLLLEVWGVAVVGSLAVGLAGAKLPTYRSLTFALPFSLGVGLAPLLPPLLARSSGTPRRAAAVVAGIAIAAAAATPTVLAWYRGYADEVGPRTSAAALQELETAGRYAAALPGGGPVIIVVNNPNPAVTDFWNTAIYADLPPDLQPRVLVFVGHGSDLLAGRPSRFGPPAQDRLAAELFAGLRPALAAGAPILAGRALDAPGYLAAARAGRPVVAGVLAVLRGPDVPVPAAPPTGPLPPWYVLAWRALAVLAILALVGAGWSRVVLPRPAAVAAALAPAFGAVALAVITMALARSGLAMRGGAAAAALAGATVASLAAWLAAGRGIRRGRAAAGPG